MKRPLAMVALFYTGGILFADWHAFPLSWLLGISIIVALVAILWGRARPFLVIPLLVLFGLSNQTFRTATLSPHDLRVLIGERQEPVTLRGVLTQTPYHRLYGGGDQGPSVRTIAFLETTSVSIAGTNFQPAVGIVLVSTPGQLPPLFYGGQLVAITGFIAQPKGAAAQGLFDYRAYLVRQAIYYQLHAASTNHWRVISSPQTRPVSDRFCAWAQATLARGLPTMDEPLRLLWAMTLGWKTALNNEVARPFMRSGTLHVFAISGLHIALIATILVALLRTCKVPRAICGLMVIPAIWFYTGVTGWQASAIRSTIMSSVLIAGWAINRPGNLLNSLAASGLLILVWDPQQLFQASFQLSFFVVLSLVLLCPPLIEFRERLLEPDPFLPRRFVPRWREQLNQLLRWVSNGIITSLAAWVGSTPLIAYYFHLVTPGSLLANLLVVPLSSLALMSNIGSLFTGAWFPGCAALFNHAAWFFMVLMIRVSEWFAWARGSCFNIAAPGPLTMVLHYAVAVSFLTGYWRIATLRRYIGLGLALLALLWVAQRLVERAAIRLTILPLPGGQAIYLRGPGTSEHCLVDCGDEEGMGFLTGPFLRAQGVNALPQLLLTHGDARHVGGAALLRRDYTVREIWLSPVRFRSRVYRDLQVQFDKVKGLTKRIQDGARAGPWTVLHPDPKEKFPRADDQALVLLGQFGGTRVLLLSDLGKPGQNALARRHPELRADIVVSGLPDLDEPLADGFIDLLQPRLIIIVDSESPARARANRKLQERLSAHDRPILYTHDTGTITFTFRKSAFEIHTMADRK